MKDLVEVLESYMIAEEGIISTIKNKFKKKPKQLPKIPYAQYESQYEPKIKRMYALCKSELPRIFKDPKYKMCLKGYSMWKPDEGESLSEWFPSMPVVNYNYWDMYPDLRRRMQEDKEASDIMSSSFDMVIEMIERCAAKAGLSGKAECGGDWDDGSIDFSIDCNYSGVESDN